MLRQNVSKKELRVKGEKLKANHKGTKNTKGKEVFYSIFVIIPSL